MTETRTAPALATPVLSPLVLQARRVTGEVVGRRLELAAIQQELRSVRSRGLTALTLEGEPGIGKTRLLLATADLADAAGFTPLAVTADEQIRGPFLLARAIFACPPAQERAAGTEAEEQLQRALDAMSGRDDPTLERLSPGHKLLRVYDLGAVAIRALAALAPLAVLVDDLQWADDDSVRMLRYIVRTDPDVPLFVALATRPHELASVTEATTLIADLERMGIVRRLKLSRFTQVETAEFLRQVLGGRINAASAATVHAQAEGVPFIVEELARTYRDAGLIQEIDGLWTLVRNAERLVPSAVRTLIERRAARLPQETRAALAEAAILGRSCSLKDLRALKLYLGEAEELCTPTSLAEALAPAVQAGLLVEHAEGSPADYSFTHDQVREFASAALTPARRRSIHAAIVDLVTAEGEPPPASLSLLAQHAVAAGDVERAARFSIAAAREALRARAPEEVLRIVDEALPAAPSAQDRVALLTARDDALDMLRRPAERLEGLAELGALADALGDSHLELDVMLRRAAALRLSGEEELAAQLARRVRTLAAESGDRRAELAACLELGQDLLRSPLGESSSPPAEVDFDGATEAYERAAGLAEELGDLAALAAATRELGVISVGRARAWYVERMRRDELGDVMRRIAAGELPEEILPDLPTAPLIADAISRFERAAQLFEQVGDRGGLMATINARAFLKFAIYVHLRGSARRIEELRRLTTELRSLTRESERAMAEAQMAYGVHVFARAKVVPDLALSRGQEAYERGRILGDRSLEFASAAGVALAHAELGEVDRAGPWLDRAAAAVAAAPTPLRARQLEVARGVVRAAAGDVSAMRQHLDRAVRLAAEQGRPAARCEVLARLALEAARLGAQQGDQELLALAERSASEAKELVELLPGHPPWGAQADAALAEAALARGDRDGAAEAGRAAVQALKAAHLEDALLEVVLPAARGIIAGGTEEEGERLKDELRTSAALIAQRIADEDVRVRWFRAAVGRELSALAGPPPKPGRPDEVATGGAGLGADDSRLLSLLTEGRTNADIAGELGVSEQVVARRLAEMYARIGVSSRSEAAIFALQERVV